MKKQYRVQFDFTIEFDEGKIQLDPHITWTTPPDQEWITHRLERQRNLFRAVISQPAILERYLEYLIFVEFETASTNTWDAIFNNDDSEFENILSTALPTLNPVDHQWFAEALDEQVFFDNTEEFQSGFSVSWDRAALTKLTTPEDKGEEQ